MTDEVTPAADVAATLAERMPDLELGTSLRIGAKVFPVPSTAATSRMVGVRNTTGSTSIPFLGDVAAGRVEETVFVEVGIREDKNDPRGLEALANRVVDVLDLQPPTGYFECRVEGGGFQRLGDSPEGHPEATVNLRLKRDSRWLPIFYGPAVDPGPGGYDLAFCEALGGTDPRTRRRFTFFAANVAAGRKLFVALPAKYGAPIVRNNTTKAAIAGSVVDPAVVLTLPHGGETFLVWASTATALGSLGISIV